MSPIAKDDETPTGHKGYWRPWVALALFTVVARGGVLAVAGGQLEHDPDAYAKLAENLRQTGVYGWRTASGDGSQDERMQPTAFRPPLYPLVLAALAVDGQVTPLAVGCLHLGAGTATALLVLMLAHWWRVGRLGWLAALFTACDPILLNQSRLVMTETLATLLAVLAAVALTWSDRSRRWPAAFSAGLVMGLAVLCRPTFLPWLACAGLVFIDRARRGNPRQLVFVVAAVAVLLPWMARNARELGTARLTTTHGGYTLLLGNNPLFYDFLRERRRPVWDAEVLARAWGLRHATQGPDDARWGAPERLPEAIGEGTSPSVGGHGSSTTSGNVAEEIASDRFAYALAWRYIRERPGDFLWSSVVRVSRFWRLVPHPLEASESTPRRWGRYAVGLWYSLLFSLAALGAVAVHRRLFRVPWLWATLLCLTFTGVHAFYWSNMRMRACVMPFVCLLAARGVWAAREWWQRARRPV